MDNKWTRFDSGESIGGIQGTDQFFMVPTSLVHIVVGPGWGAWDRKSIIEQSQKSDIPASLVKNNSGV